MHTANVIGISESIALKFGSGKIITPEQQRILNRFYLALILNELMQFKTSTEISASCLVDRGLVQNLMDAVVTNSHKMLKFCKEISEIWCFKALLANLINRLTCCCKIEFNVFDAVAIC